MHDQETYDHLTVLLAHLAQQHGETEQTYPTTDEVYAASSQPHVIDVYILDHTAEEAPMPIIESTLDTPMEQEPQEYDEPIPPLAPPLARRSTHPRWWLLLVGVLMLCACVVCMTSLFAFFIQTPSATVTLVLQAHSLSTTTTLHVVPAGHTDPTMKTLAGRVIPALSMSEQQSVPTTGIVHQAAQAAHGSVTFYNAAPYTQTIPAGTLLTGSDGVSVVTEQDALVPAAVMPTEGQVTVAAHAVQVGTQGNIGAGAIYGACCRLNVFVANEAFTGGQNAQTYQTVTAQDVQGVVTHLTPSLMQSVQAAFQTQVHPNETLLTPLACTPQVTPAPQMGMQAATVSVTVNETCTGMTYRTQDFTTLATQDATHKASTQFGTGYTTTGVQTTITQVIPDAHGVFALHVTSYSLWMAQMSDTQQQALKTMLAGTSQAQATALLLHLTGVQSVSLTLSHGATLPNDTTRIALLIIEPQE